MEKFKAHIEISMKNAEHGISKLPEELLSMEGMSGRKTRHFYNNIVNIEDASYLEIGTWKGSSVCSAMYGNSARVVCMDNWANFNGPRYEFMNNFNRYRGSNDASFIENDCFKVDVSTLPKFNIYMYDGDHSHQSHYKALTHYYDCLEDIFIFMVDDWNFIDIRNATRNAIRDLKLEILYEKEIIPHNNMETPQHIAAREWWNGIYVAVLKKSQA